MAAQLGPYSRPAPLARIDGRSREARLLKAIRSDLTTHVGGNPSATERAFIDRAAWLSLRVAQLDARIAAGTVTDHDSRTYLAWSNSLARTLRELGLRATEPRQRSIGELAAAFEAEQAAATAARR